MFERFRPHPPVYLFPVFLFVTGWFGCPLWPAVVNMLLWMVWLKGGDVVKSTTRWPLIFLSLVETTLTALSNTQTHSDYQDYNMVSEVFE
jgi:hypothetical protein